MTEPDGTPAGAAGLPGRTAGRLGAGPARVRPDGRRQRKQDEEAHR